jgi:hypothetical protein
MPGPAKRGSPRRAGCGSFSTHPERPNIWASTPGPRPPRTGDGCRCPGSVRSGDTSSCRSAARADPAVAVRARSIIPKPRRVLHGTLSTGRLWDARPTCLAPKRLFAVQRFYIARFQDERTGIRGASVAMSAHSLVRASQCIPSIRIARIKRKSSLVIQTCHLELTQISVKNSPKIPIPAPSSVDRD